MKEILSPGNLVRVVHPGSLKRMNVVGIITELKYPSENWFQVWIPDIGKSICFEKNQIEVIR